MVGFLGAWGTRESLPDYNPQYGKEAFTTTYCIMAPRVGLEPTTTRLTAGRSAN